MDSLNRETPTGVLNPPVLKKTQSRFICDAKDIAVFSANYIKEGRYRFDNVTPYIRYKYMTDVWYNRMIEIGFWWWRLEIHYHNGRVGRFFAELFHTIDWLVRFAYYLIINKKTKIYFI